MRALLLAAGHGTRLRPITDTIPKCMVDIDGRPLLDYWLELLERGGITDVLVNLHYLPEPVRAFLAQSRRSLNIATAFEENLLGTAGTLHKNRAFFDAGPAMLIHADNLSLFDMRRFVERFETRPTGIDMTMMTFRTDTPKSCGIVELDAAGVVRAFHEKPENPVGNLANGAVYILAPPVMQFIANLGKDVIDFSTEVLPRFVGRINTFHNDTYHRDIGTPESLATARREFPAIAKQWAKQG